MDTISLSVIHAPVERLKKGGTGLHLAAALLILAHAISHLRSEESAGPYFWCQLLISLDILLLLLAGRNILRQLPRVNLFFRIVEVVFFAGIGGLMLAQRHPLTGVIHLSLSLVYGCLCWCEKEFRPEELLSFHHTGVTIPGIPAPQFLLWTAINRVEAHYDTIEITTSDNKTLRFDFRRNLGFEELEQIHEFCRHYIGQ